MRFKTKPKTSFNKVRFLDKYMEGHHGFIAGGCFKNVFKNERVKDIDIFFRDKEDFSLAKDYYEKNDEYVFSYDNEKVWAFKNKKTNIRIELIKSVFGTPEEILSKFDFSITKFAYVKYYTEKEVEYKCLYVETFFEDLVNSKLVIDGVLEFPVSTFERTYRYRDYGFGLCRESKAKLLDSLKTADTNDLSNDLYFGLD